jgi:hypothetical protein
MYQKFMRTSKSIPKWLMKKKTILAKKPLSILLKKRPSDLHAKKRTSAKTI